MELRPTTTGHDFNAVSKNFTALGFGLEYTGLIPIIERIED